MKEVWSIRARARLELDGDVRNLVLFNLAINSKLRGCDLVRLKVGDVAAGGHVKSRGVVVQKKTGRPVQFEITESTRRSVIALLGGCTLGPDCSATIWVRDLRALRTRPFRTKPRHIDWMAALLRACPPETLDAR